MKINNEKLNLNIGCGKNIKKVFINIDKYFDFDIGIINGCACLKIDLNNEKLTDYFDEATIDYIFCSHIVEHLIDPYSFILECHKILKKDGTLLVKLPSNFTCISHLRNHHNYSYMDGLLTNNGLGFQNQKLFYKVYVKGNVESISYLLMRFYKWFISWFVSEYEYKLKKI